MGYFDKKKINFAIVNTVVYIVLSIISQYHIEDRVLNLDNVNQENKKWILPVINGIIFGLLSLLTTNILPLTSYL